MDHREILRRNDGNGVSEDGTQFIIHQLNPNRMLPNEPEYIDEEIPIEGNEGWATEYRGEQGLWATSQERYHDEQVNISGVPVEPGEDPMEVMLNLIEDNSFNPEAILGYFKEQESAERKRILELLTKFKEQMNADWQELLFQMYNLNKRFSDMVREHEKETGEKKSNQSFSKRHKKAIDFMKDKFEAEGYEVDRSPKRKRGAK